MQTCSSRRAPTVQLFSKRRGTCRTCIPKNPSEWTIVHSARGHANTLGAWQPMMKCSLQMLCFNGSVKAVKPGFSLERVWSVRFRPRLIYMWAVCHDNNLFLTSRRGESGAIDLGRMGVELLTKAEFAVSRNRKLNSAKTTKGMWDALVSLECAGVCVRNRKTRYEWGTWAIPSFCQHSARLPGLRGSTGDTHWADVPFTSQSTAKTTCNQMTVCAGRLQSPQSPCRASEWLVLQANSANFLLKKLNNKYSSNNRWRRVKMMPTLAPHRQTALVKWVRSWKFSSWTV